MAAKSGTAFPDGKPKIPYLVLVPVINDAMKESGLGVDALAASTRWKELIRERCGQKYAGVPLDDVQTLMVAARKRALTDSTRDKGHGKPVLKPLSAEYEAYMSSPEWKKKAKWFIERYDGHCCICRSRGPLEIHHNTYANFGNEQPDDCIPVCHPCHLICDRRRKIEQREFFAEMQREAELEAERMKWRRATEDEDDGDDAMLFG